MSQPSTAQGLEAFGLRFGTSKPGWIRSSLHLHGCWPHHNAAAAPKDARSRPGPIRSSAEGDLDWGICKGFDPKVPAAHWDLEPQLGAQVLVRSLFGLETMHAATGIGCQAVSNLSVIMDSHTYIDPSAISDYAEVTTPGSSPALALNRSVSFLSP